LRLTVLRRLLVVHASEDLPFPSLPAPQRHLASERTFEHSS
jgi:hypothetical protein